MLSADIAEGEILINLSLQTVSWKHNLLDNGGGRLEDRNSSSTAHNKQSGVC